MSKRLSDPRTFDDYEGPRGHAPERKGREKQTLERYIHEWQSFDDWDDAPVETFQRFNKRGNK